ncbi:MAG TPA: hypothetical protein VGC09_00525 [Rhodopila sp.]
MRTFGRVTDEFGNKTWVVVTTDANGFDDAVYLTTLCQVCKGAPNASPFFSNYGIPAQQSVVTQVLPDFYVNRTQQQFAQYFASLTVQRVSASPPTYNINPTANAGAILLSPVPQ